jgi:metal-dependent amidase/aminoacylase/carboxypeptidase family protein
VTRPLSARRAGAILDAAILTKAPDWAEFRTWHVVSGDTILVTIEPSYRGARRNGWTWRLPGGSAHRWQPEPTREKAAVAGLMAWRRQATTN